MTLTLLIATEPPSLLLSPTSSPSSLLSHQVRDRGMQGDGEVNDIRPADLVEDYGIWDPVPTTGGGNVAPIPHSGES